MENTTVYHGVRLDNGQKMASPCFYRCADGRIFLATAGTDVAIGGKAEHEITLMASVDGKAIFAEIDPRTFEERSDKYAV